MSAESLTEFLLARITEDEALARAAMPLGARWTTVADTGAGLAGSDAGLFILYHNPVRVLAECEAKRRIVELHAEREVSPSCSECGGYTATTDPARGIVHHGYAIPWPCPTLRLLALPYADHPDYRAEWRP